MSEQPTYAAGGFVGGEPVEYTYRHDLDDPTNHKGHPITWNGYCCRCRRYVTEHLIGRDGHCTVCGAWIIDVDKTLATLRQIDQTEDGNQPCA